MPTLPLRPARPPMTGVDRLGSREADRRAALLHPPAQGVRRFPGDGGRTLAALPDLRPIMGARD